MNDAAQTRLTVDDLLSIADDKNYELVDGELVERNTGNEASSIAVNLLILLGVYNRRHRLGVLLESEAGYRCFRDS
jgi:hypothetical protein